MKKNLLILFVATVCLSSCAIRPDTVLSNREMVSLLVDLHRAEGILQVAGYNYNHDADVDQYYAVILDHHGVTQAQFDSSLVWYTEHPAYFSRVYPKVRKRLQEMYDEEQLNLNRTNDNALMREKMRKDSLFLQQEPPLDSIADHKCWEMHRFHTKELYLAPEFDSIAVPFLSTVDSAAVSSSNESDSVSSLKTADEANAESQSSSASSEKRVMPSKKRLDEEDKTAVLRKL